MGNILYNMILQTNSTEICELLPTWLEGLKRLKESASQGKAKWHSIGWGTVFGGSVLDFFTVFVLKRGKYWWHDIRGTRYSGAGTRGNGIVFGGGGGGGVYIYIYINIICI